MFCKNCGTELGESAYMCEKCGAVVRAYKQPETKRPEKKDGIYLDIISLTLTVLAIILVFWAKMIPFIVISMLLAFSAMILAIVAMVTVRKVNKTVAVSSLISSVLIFMVTIAFLIVITV